MTRIVAGQALCTSDVVLGNSEDAIAERQVDPARLLHILDLLAENEARIADRFYDLFFEGRPDARPLFGAHAIAEQEEMMRETLRSIHAWMDDESWLRANLRALGQSHWEYGVTSDMYPSFVETMVICCREVLGDRLDDSQSRILRSALESMIELMRSAGDDAAAANSP